jgi:hypothetical protein
MLRPPNTTRSPNKHSHFAEQGEVWEPKGRSKSRLFSLLLNQCWKKAFRGLAVARNFDLRRAKLLVTFFIYLQIIKAAGILCAGSSEFLERVMLVELFMNSDVGLPFVNKWLCPRQEREALRDGIPFNIQ